MPSETVKVIVRVRPFNQREKDNGSKPCVNVDEKINQIEIVKPQDHDVKTFSYDYVFSQDTPQQIIYEKTAFPLVESVVDGYNGTIFAYGQTGCGKTFTMAGIPSSESLKGIIPRTFEQIINIININSDANKEYLLRCSYIEIYNEEIHDLLGKDVKQKLDIKEDPNKGMSIKDLQIISVRTTQEMDKYMNIGTHNRSVGETAMNKESSRSHSIFTVYVECSITDAKGNPKITAGKLNLVDLAGSERQSKTQATGDRLKEATKINLSLSALGNVISALVDGKTQHIPYRDSKLTRLLQDSLGGNTKTIMITAVSPSDFNYDETLSSLRYASRAKQIKNQPKINQDPKDALLKEQAEEIRKLKEMLQKAGQGIQLGQLGQNPVQNNNIGPNGPTNGVTNGPLNSQQQQQQQQQQNGVNNNNVNLGAAEISKLKEENNKLLQEKQKIEEGAKQSKQKELEQFMVANNKLLQEKEKFEQDLKQKEQIAEQERLARLQLEQLLKEKESMVMKGGKGSEEEKKKYRNLQKKVTNQKKEHEQLLQEREQQQEELLQYEQKFQNVQEEVEQLRKLTKYLRKKLQESLSDNKDLEREHEYDKEELLDTVRVQDKELKLYQSVVKMMFGPDEFESLKGACDWDEEKQEYTVPPFIFKQKKVNYPKLPPTQAIEFIESEKQNRYIELKVNSRQSDASEKGSANDLIYDNPRMTSPYGGVRKSDSQGKANGSLTQLEKGMLVVEKNRQSYQQMQQQYSYNVTPASGGLIPNLEKKNQKVMLNPIDNNRGLINNNSSNYSSQSSPPVTKKNVNLMPLDRPPIPHQDTPEMRRKQHQKIQ